MEELNSNFTPEETYHLNISKIISEWNDGDGDIEPIEAMKQLTALEVEHIDMPKEKNKDAEKLKEMKENLNKRKLDIIEALAEEKNINHPQIIVGMVYELRSIVDTLNYLNDKKPKENKFQNYAT